MPYMPDGLITLGSRVRITRPAIADAEYKGEEGVVSGVDWSEASGDLLYDYWEVESYQVLLPDRKEPLHVSPHGLKVLDPRIYHRLPE